MNTPLYMQRPTAFELSPAAPGRSFAVNDFIVCSEGMSNAYAIQTDAGRVIVNTGMGFEAPAHRENFDAAGRWRTEDYYEYKSQRKSWTIDASGKFHNGPAFADFFELRDQVVSREEDFAAGFAEALVSYALGRPAGFSDRELIEQMVERAKENDYRAREFFHVLIQHSRFQSKPQNP